MSGRQWRLENNRISAAHTVCRYVVPKGSHGAPGYELQGTSSYSALEAWNQACAALSLCLFHSTIYNLFRSSRPHEQHIKPHSQFSEHTVTAGSTG